MVRQNSEKTWEKVGRLLPSLGRSNGHEIVATARAIDAALKADGRDWHDLSEAVKGIGRRLADQTTSAMPPVPTGAPSFGDKARACRELDRGQLAPRERAFVADMCRRGFSFWPSPRQARWLGDLFDRLKAGRAAA